MNIKPLIRKNPLNRKNSKLKNTSFIDLRSHMELFFRFGFFKRAKILILKDYGYDPLTNAEDFDRILSEKKVRSWSKDAQREFSQLFSLNYFLKIDDFEDILRDGFYFHYYFDFRGRLYADSPIAYTHNRLFRYFYYYGAYTKEELLNFKKLLPLLFLKNVGDILAQTNIKKEYSRISYEDEVTQYYILIIFFEIGKLFKNKYVVECDGCLTFEKIQQIGVYYFNNNSLVAGENLYTQLEYLSLMCMLDDLNNGLYLKYPIFKDATASGLQILTLLLGAKDRLTYVRSNLVNESVAYDAYYYIIKDFLNSVIVPDHLKKYFTRKILKIIIMVFNYNAGLITC
jgi:hypothetical protein